MVCNWCISFTRLSEKRCNCVSLTSTNSLSLRQQSTLTSSSLGSSSSQCFHWVFSVSSVKSSHPSLLLLGVWNNSLALVMYGAMNLSFPCSSCVTGWGQIHFEVKAILYLSISSNGGFNSLCAPTKLVPWSLCSWRIEPLLQINLQSALMNCLQRHTREKRSIRLKFFTTLLDYEWAKEIESTVGEGWCGMNTAFW